MNRMDWVEFTTEKTLKKGQGNPFQSVRVRYEGIIKPTWNLHSTNIELIQHNVKRPITEKEEGYGESKVPFIYNSLGRLK